MPNQKLICFGEVLWDLLPAGKMIGGAPLNVAYHANNLGLPSGIISKVGSDDLGRELLEALQAKGISTDLIQTDLAFPTGRVKVTFEDRGSPSYEIVQPVAWDNIHSEPEIEEAVKSAEAFVFGSLACRTERTRKTLFHLLDRAPLKIFDVNLRPPFYSKTLLETLLHQADIVKMNEEELSILAGWSNIISEEVNNTRQLITKFGLQAVILTKGGEGALYISEQEVFHQPAFPIVVEDTVGSGDSFLAAFLFKMLDGRPAAECLAFAAAMGAIVATRKGGTPYITPKDIIELRDTI